MALAARKIETEPGPDRRESPAPPGAGSRECPSPAEVLALVKAKIDQADGLGAARKPGAAWTDRAKVGDYERRRDKGLPDGRVSAKAAIARQIGVHEATLGRYLAGTNKPSPVFAAKAWEWLGLVEARRLDGEAISGAAEPAVTLGKIEGPLAETSTVRAVAKLCRYCLQERVMGMVISETSCGKTTSLLAYARTNPSAIYVHASVVRTATKRGMMQAIARGSGMRGKRSAVEEWDGLVKYLAGGGGPASTRIILVDDAHVLSYGVLECLRDLHDEAGVGIVLAGTSRLSSRVSLKADAYQMYEQLRARVAIVLPLGKPSPSDVEAVARAWLPEGRQVEITREATEWLARLAVGMGALRIVKAHVRGALRLRGDDRVNGTLGMDHLAAAHEQLDAGVLA